MSSPLATDLDLESPEHHAFVTFARLTSKKRDLKEELDAIEAQLRALEPQLLAYLGEGGYQLVRVEGYTISPHREPWVYPRQGQTRGSVCQALKACGLAHYVNEQFNTRSLTKYIRDLEVQHQLLSTGGDVIDLLPKELALVIEVRPTYRIQALRR